MAARPAKRKLPESTSSSAQTISDDNQKVLELIKSRKDDGISLPQIKRETKLPNNIVITSLQNLIMRKRIREFVHATNKRSKHYIGVEFKPSKEVSGGDWYTDGQLDVTLVKYMKDSCLKAVREMKVATAVEIGNCVRDSRVFNVDFRMSQINEILLVLVLDGKVEEVTSDGKVRYRLRVGKMVEDGAMSSIPCGVCPRISDCRPDSQISPNSCIYMNTWLDF